MKGLPDELEVDIIALLTHYGLSKIEKVGREIRCVCPFHGDTDPSLYINTVTGYWHCFSCESNGSKGNIVGFVRKIEKSSKEYAKNFLLNFAYELDGDRLKEILKFQISKGEHKVRYISGKRYLENPMRAYEWLKTKRRISPKVAANAEIGWDKENNSIVIPIKDDSNWKNIGFVKRNLDEKIYRYTKDARVHDYLYRIPSNDDRYADRLLIVEGALDCLRIETIIRKLKLERLYEPVAILGNRTSDLQFKKLVRLNDKFTLMLDNDYGGDQGIQRLNDLCSNYGISYNVDVVVYPNHAKDPGDMNIKEISASLQNKIGLFRYANEYLH